MTAHVMWDMIPTLSEENDAILVTVDTLYGNSHTCIYGVGTQSAACMRKSADVSCVRSIACAP